MSTYLVKFCRPVFQTAVVRVEADGEIEAALKANSQANKIQEQEWQSDDASHYIVDLQAITRCDSKTEQALVRKQLENENTFRYVLLKSDLGDGNGAILLQPWYFRQNKEMQENLDRSWAIALSTHVEKSMPSLGKKHRERHSHEPVSAKVLRFPLMPQCRAED